MTSYLAPGKLILSGEYSVLFGNPAIVISIDKYIEVSIETASEFQIEIYGKLFHGGFSEIANKIYSLSPHTFKTLNFFKKEGLKLDNLKIKIKSVIPFKGLGSSAALITCLSYALLDFNDINISKNELLAKTYKIKRMIEGGSPTDLVASIFGGINLIRYNDEEIYHEKLSRDIFKENDIRLYAIYTGEKAVTKNILKNVLKDIESTAYKKKLIEKMGRLTKKIWDSLKHGDMEDVFKLVRLNHYLLASLGVSTATIDRIADLLNEREVRYVVAKISGAGFGDSLICLSKKDSDICKELDGTRCIKINVDKLGVRRID